MAIELDDGWVTWPIWASWKTKLIFCPCKDWNPVPSSM